MICPQNENLFFFAHEGDTRYISNRLWIYDHENKSMKNIAKQRLNSDGELADCFGHEAWAPDGSGMYFIKYDLSPSSLTGICFVDAASGEFDILYSEYKYWHVGVSADGRYLTADTRYPGEWSEIILVDRESGEQKLIDIAPTTKKHPCHPPPILSPDNKKIAYTSLDSRGNTCVKITFI